jgi:hypothetical protein
VKKENNMEKNTLIFLKTRKTIEKRKKISEISDNFEVIKGINNETKFNDNNTKNREYGINDHFG